MAKFRIYIVCFCMLLLGSAKAFAQETPTAKASVDKNQILIGEPIRLSIDIHSPTVTGNQLPQFDSIPHFELIEKANRDSVISANGVLYHLEWKLTSFDSGTRYIPSFSVNADNRIIKTDSLAIEVSYGKVDTAQDYHDIKGIIDLENPGVKYIPWVVGAITLIALVLFIWFKKRREFSEPVADDSSSRTTTSALDEAMLRLDQLKAMLHADPNSVKKYYSGINDTLRIFLQKRAGLVTMEKTSGEIILSLSRLNMERDLFGRLTEALRMGDFVKFAKYVPGPYENENNLETIRSSIVFINEKQA